MLVRPAGFKRNLSVFKHFCRFSFSLIQYKCQFVCVSIVLVSVCAFNKDMQLFTYLLFRSVVTVASFAKHVWPFAVN